MRNAFTAEVEHAQQFLTTLEDEEGSGGVMTPDRAGAERLAVLAERDQAAGEGERGARVALLPVD